MNRRRPAPRMPANGWARNTHSHSPRRKCGGRTGGCQHDFRWAGAMFGVSLIVLRAATSLLRRYTRLRTRRRPGSSAADWPTRRAGCHRSNRQPTLASAGRKQRLPPLRMSMLGRSCRLPTPPKAAIAASAGMLTTASLPMGDQEAASATGILGRVPPELRVHECRSLPQSPPP